MQIPLTLAQSPGSTRGVQANDTRFGFPRWSRFPVSNHRDRSMYIRRLDCRHDSPRCPYMYMISQRITVTISAPKGQTQGCRWTPRERAKNRTSANTYSYAANGSVFFLNCIAFGSPVRTDPCCEILQSQGSHWKDIHGKWCISDLVVQKMLNICTNRLPVPAASGIAARENDLHNESPNLP